MLEDGPDPLTLRRQIALKMMLNAHSTGIMAALGRVVGNTMTNVSPSNLKLIGRATYLVQTHVNDSLPEPVGFAEANAVVMDAMDYVRAEGMGQTAEVALSIIRIVESVRRGRNVTWPEARRILDTRGLAAFLQCGAGVRAFEPPTCGISKARSAISIRDRYFRGWALPTGPFCRAARRIRPAP